MSRAARSSRTCRVGRSPSGDANYRFVKGCRKQFLHYYWYVLDPVMGPMSVRVASYFPFNVTCYLNGHSFGREVASPFPCLAVLDKPFQRDLPEDLTAGGLAELAELCQGREDI